MVDKIEESELIVSQFSYKDSASSKLFAVDEDFRGCRMSAYCKPDETCSGSSIAASFVKTVFLPVAAIVMVFHSLF